MELIPPREGQSVFPVNHPSGYSREWLVKRGGMSDCQAYGAILEDIKHIVRGVVHVPKKFGR